MRSLAIILSWIILVWGCATTYELKGTPAENVAVEFQSGELIQKVFKTNLVAAKVFKSEVRSDRKGAFVIAVGNLTQTPLTISPNCVRLETEGTPVKIYNYSELKDEVEKKARQQAAALVLMGMGAAMQAAKPQYSWGTLTAWGPGGSVQGTYSGYTYDPARAAAAQAIIGASIANQINALEASKTSELQIVEAVVREHTLYPGQTYTGLVVFEPPTGKDRQNIILKVDLPPDIYEFRFLYAKK